MDLDDWHLDFGAVIGSYICLGFIYLQIIILLIWFNVLHPSNGGDLQMHLLFTGVRKE